MLLGVELFIFSVQLDGCVESFTLLTGGREAMLSCLMLCIAVQAHDAGVRNFTVISADEWVDHDTALGWINELTPNQTIEQTVVLDPTDDRVAYFATSAPKDGGSLLSVYRYNTQSQIYERLWRKEIASGEAGREWLVLGVDNGRVVFIEQNGGTETETCVQPVISGNDHVNGSALWSVPGDNLLVDPDTQALSWKEQPSAYAPPQEVLDEALIKQNACEG